MPDSDPTVPMEVEAPMAALDPEPAPPPAARPITNLAAFAIGAVALGALAIGALAIGTLAVGRLAIGRGRIKTLEIDDLTVRRLRVLELPEDARPPRHRGPFG